MCVCCFCCARKICKLNYSNLSRLPIFMACQVAPPTAGGRPALFTVSQTSALCVCVPLPLPHLCPLRMTKNQTKRNETKPTRSFVHRNRTIKKEPSKSERERHWVSQGGREWGRKKKPVTWHFNGIFMFALLIQRNSNNNNDNYMKIFKQLTQWRCMKWAFFLVDLFIFLLFIFVYLLQL